jgi:serine/threonine protein kinase
VLGDFGLARLRADVTSRTNLKPIDASAIAGSRNWMAPERLMGGSLKKPSDVYSFGLTTYEVGIIIF